jgi:hypothetical protein
MIGELSTTQDKICKVLDSMKDLLLYKNQKYGDSAIKPEQIFYKGDAKTAILVRLNDKISRIKNNKDELPRFNDIADTIGYCTLLLVAMDKKPQDFEALKD